MKKVKLYIASSLDGFIAGPNGEIDWLPETPGEDYGYSEFIDGIDTTLMGGETYRFVAGLDEFPYKDKRNIVFTRRKEIPKSEYVEFAQGDIAEQVRKLKAGEGKDIWLIGGGQIITPLHDAGLIDIYEIAIIPVVLGAGLPLFTGSASKRKLNLIDSKTYSSGLVMLKYSI
ncbi:MAG: dihydrofolate reductase [Ignavibacteriales bacterium]|nr:MAG: dihydrofolate reductase [Ignavibacteriales bacterium]